MHRWSKWETNTQITICKLQDELEEEKVGET